MSNIAQDWLNSQTDRQALFTDIDNTLVRSGAQYAHAAKQVREYTATRRIPLFLVTGLSVNKVLARIETGEIPQPEGICGSVGTEIWMQTNSNIWQKDAAYHSAVKALGFNATTVGHLMADFIATAAEHEFVFQPGHAQSQHKVSVYFMATPKQAARLQEKAAKHFTPFKVVVCKDITAAPSSTERQKFCMDIVPVTKGDAVGYLVRQLGILGGWKAGDSGNDIEMLFHDDALTPILVGGYTQEAGEIMLAGAHHKRDSTFKLSDGRLAYIETGSQKAGESILAALNVL